MEEILKSMIGSLIVQIAALQAEVARLQTELKKHESGGRVNCQASQGASLGA